ncbi:MAG: contractile injection system protein, VgrG/Pvc8 family, partial [Stenotrophomonas sp.]
MSTALSAISHSNRLIKLQAPNEDLVVERFDGEEALCGDMRLQIDCLSTDAYLQTDSWLEQPLTLQLQLPGGSQRQWHGLCTNVAQLG